MGNTPVRCDAKDKALCRVHGRAWLIEQTSALINKNGNPPKASIGVLTRYYEADPAGVELLIEEIEEVLAKGKSGEYSLPDARDAEQVEALIGYKYHDYQTGRASAQVPYLHDWDAIDFVLWQLDPEKTTLPEHNLLDGTEQNYQTALAGYLADNGTPVKHRTDTYFAWEDLDTERHVRRDCAIVAVTNPREDSWREFIDTFASENDTDDYKHGITGEGQCRCGRFKGELRVEGDVRTLMGQLFDSLNRRR